MDGLATAVARLSEFALAMTDEPTGVVGALGVLRRRLADAHISYRLVGGLAVLHHGYHRTTEDIDVLIRAEDLRHIVDEVLFADFVEVADMRLAHRESGTRVDLLVAGAPVPRRDGETYPSPDDMLASPRASDVIGLADLIALKLMGGRHQDHADVVALLKRMDDSEYSNIEAHQQPKRRPSLLELRKDALEERKWEK